MDRRRSAAVRLRRQRRERREWRHRRQHAHLGHGLCRCACRRLLRVQRLHHVCRPSRMRGAELQQRLPHVHVLASQRLCPLRADVALPTRNAAKAPPIPRNWNADARCTCGCGGAAAAWDSYAARRTAGSPAAAVCVRRVRHCCIRAGVCVGSTAHLNVECECGAAGNTGKHCSPRTEDADVSPSLPGAHRTTHTNNISNTSTHVLRTFEILCASLEPTAVEQAGAGCVATATMLMGHSAVPRAAPVRLLMLIVIMLHYSARADLFFLRRVGEAKLAAASAGPSAVALASSSGGSGSRSSACASEVGLICGDGSRSASLPSVRS